MYQSNLICIIVPANSDSPVTLGMHALNLHLAKISDHPPSLFTCVLLLCFCFISFVFLSLLVTCLLSGDVCQSGFISFVFFPLLVTCLLSGDVCLSGFISFVFFFVGYLFVIWRCLSVGVYFVCVLSLLVTCLLSGDVCLSGFIPVCVFLCWLPVCYLEMSVCRGL